MTKVIVGNLNAKKARGAKSVALKRVRAADGSLRTVRTLDGASSTFTEDLRYVFGRNVAKAREDNRKIIGVADVAPRKR